MNDLFDDQIYFNFQSKPLISDFVNKWVDINNKCMYMIKNWHGVNTFICILQNFDHGFKDKLKQKSYI